MADRVGQQLGSYKLISLIGTGGFAEVYLGEHIYLKTQAAIKVLQTRLTGEDTESFLNEARTIAHLKHNNIIRVLEFGIEQNIPYLVMDYAPHGTLRRLHPKGSRLSLATILPYVQQIASALQYAHNQKVIHRDVKPENFLLGANHEVLLSDFGIATMAPNSRSLDTSENIIAGTIAYMAPEQIQGRSRPASDQYALGAIVYEWLCGKPPFQGSFLEISTQHLHVFPSSLREQVPEISIAMEIVVLTALAKDPQQRFASISAFANALDQVYQLENPNQPLNKLILPAASTPSHSSTIQSDSGASIHSIPTIEQLPTQYSLSTSNAIEDMLTVELQPASPEDVDKTVSGPQIVALDRCAACNAEIQPGNAFCLNCGTSTSEHADSEEDFIRTVTSGKNLSPLTAPSPPPASYLNKCPFCGAQARPGDNFCLNCGNRLLPSTPAPASAQPAAQDATVAPDDWGTIGDRFEPTFATVAPTEEEAHSIIAPPTPLPIGSYAGLSLEQIKERLFAEGDEHYRAKRYKDALNAYQQILQVDARDVRAHGSKGNALGKLGRYKDALEAYTTALSIDPSHPSIWSAKGDMLAKQRNYAASLDAYNQALTLNPKDALTWKTKGNLLSRFRNYNEALVAYDSALTLKPNDATVWAIKGNLHYKLGQYDEALVAYTCSLDLAPRRSVIWEGKGDVLSKLRKYAEALIAYERAYILNPSNAALIHKCEMHRELKQRQDELTQVQKAEPKTQAPPRRGSSSPPRHTHARREKTGDKTQIVGVFDVFLSYSDEDAPWVEELARQLEDEGEFQVWLDKWILVPGEPWISARAEAIEQARSCIVCIGETTPISWFEQEIQKAINRQKSEPNSTFRVIPVLLPNAQNDNVRANLKNFLELNAWVDFRKFDYDYAFHLLMSGIRGEPPGRWPKEEVEVMSKEMIAERKLRKLKRYHREGIVDDSLIVDIQRQVLTKIWLNSEEDIDE